MPYPRRFGAPVVGLAVAAFVYFIALPLAWRPPTVEAELPAAATLKQDLEFTVRLTALHGNFDVANIRFYVDFYGSTAKGPKGLFDPAVVFSQRPRAILSGWSMSHLTYPHTLEIPVKVPFPEFAGKGLLGEGVLAGKVDVTYVSCEPSAGKSASGADRMRAGTQSIPFSITIQD